MRLGSGIAPIKEMMESNVRVSIGVDGSASNDAGNMLMELRNAMMISRLREEQYWLSARDVLWLGTRGGASVLGRNDIGQLSVGKQADLALFSVNTLEYAGALSDPIAALIFNVRTSPVAHLIIHGKSVINHGQSSLDESSLISTHNQIAKTMLTSAQDKTRIDFLKMSKD